jgi:Zn-dependent peptidase ImmA (M78 family)
MQKKNKEKLRQRCSFLEFTNMLKKKFPSDKPIRVKRCLMPFDKGLKPRYRINGDCFKGENEYIIRINKEDSLNIQKDTLIHEWAHALSFPKEGEDDHSDKWGISYATVYRYCLLED